MTPEERREVAEVVRADAAPRDGIGEEDNPIPRWFWITFALSVVFAAGYVPYFTLSGWSQTEQYEAQLAVARVQREAVRAALPTTNPYRGDAAAIAEGETTFATICSACHKPDGSGLVGPSLVDPYWRYGADDQALFVSVAQGRPEGMPPWEAQLGTDKIWKALAYLETLPRSSAPGMGAPGFAGAGP
jgi:cytochrome c oxidase cbb3-type subunit 3